VAIGLAAVLAAVGPALVLVSERRIDDAVVAFERGDCGAAVDASTAAIEVLSSRPEPYEVLGFCQTRRGFNRLAIRSLEQAVRRDPRNWEFRYGLALVRGAAALDPRPDAREALRLNPRDDRTRNLVEIVEREPDWQPIVEDMARRERLAVVR
jgi:tetratricopeptide (TPR) repeat protein